MRTIYQVHVELVGIEPPIWRQLQLPSDLTLVGLHEVIRLAIGWVGAHEHHFEPEPDAADAASERDRLHEEALLHVEDLFDPEHRGLRYLYDPEWRWEHHITIEDVLEGDPLRDYPRCVDGARACPPEASGGPQGYPSLLEAFHQPAFDEHADVVRWFGAGFDPERFELEAINRRLHQADDEHWYVRDLDYFAEAKEGAPALSISYDPTLGPEPRRWLEIDQFEALLAVESYHLQKRLRRRSHGLRAHAVIHASVENQLAEDDPPAAGKALLRLIAQGLDRHEAVHAIGSVLAEQLGRAVQADSFDHRGYAAALGLLTAEVWLRNTPRPSRARIRQRIATRRSKRNQPDSSSTSS